MFIPFKKLITFSIFINLFIVCASSNAQTIKVIDNKGTIHEIIPNSPPTIAQLTQNPTTNTPSSNAFIDITFNSQDIVNGNISANTTGITINQDGFYRASYSASITSSSNTDESAEFRLTKNNVAIPESNAIALAVFDGTGAAGAGPVGGSISYSKILNLVAGDQIKLQVSHNTFFTLNLYSDPNLVITANSAILILQKI